MTASSFDAASREHPRAPSRRASRPRLAASLILIDRDGATPRVLMGRRHAGASFMPGRWVFPGGGFDRADRRAPFARDLDATTFERLARASRVSAGSARGLALAAVRETFEETGLELVGAAGAPGPDLTALRFVARAVTPPALARRFDAHFFEADADALVARAPRPSVELDAVAWLTLDQASRCNTAGVTGLLLAEVAARLGDPHRPPLLIQMRRRGREVRALDAESAQRA